MKLVIDIPSHVKNRLIFGVTYKDDLRILVEALTNGTPLPKGHGRIVDINELMNVIGLEDNNENRENNLAELITLEDIDRITTIIEADGGEEDDLKT